MKRYPHFTWLLIGILIIATTGQAVAALPMPCRDTPACCCTSMAMGASSHTPSPMPPEHGSPAGCCETAAASPCDIQKDTRTTTRPFIFSSPETRADVPTTMAGTITRHDPYRPFLKRGSEGATTSRGDPPRYLALQTILR